MLAAIPGFLIGCSNKNKEGAAIHSDPLIEEMSSGPVTVKVTVDPPLVHMDRDILLSIQVAAPSTITVRLPPIETRLRGFVSAGAFDRDPETREGRVIRERCGRLTPQVAQQYRIAPMAITYREDGVERWFPTRPIVLTAEPLEKGKPDPTLSGILGPVWIFPDARTMTRYVLLFLCLAAGAWLAWRFGRRVHRAIKLRRMSPKERALHDLAELLAKDLIAKDRVKDFYFELTMIVRCYIERAHAIRAPEQTTEEFLDAVSRDARFSPEVVARLRAFLQAADLVKYAAFRPDRPTVDRAVTTATHYIETDAEEETKRQAATVPPSGRRSVNG